MCIFTVLKPRAQLIVIQVLETFLLLSFIIVSSISEVHIAPVVFKERSNIRACSGTWEYCKSKMYFRKPRFQEDRNKENITDSGLLTKFIEKKV